MIEDAVNGRLIEPADAQGLEQAVRRTFDRREETERIIANAKETVRQRYTLEKMVEKYESLFRQLAG
jgi:glycosyltransferase involved in cell wall biosynthesis